MPAAERPRQPTRVLLHVGTHKTGTTSIQAAIAGYDDGETATAPVGAADGSLVSLAYQRWPRQATSPEEAERRRRFLHVISSADRARWIVSDEDLSARPKSAQRDLLDDLARAGVTAEVVIYLRPPLAWAAAMFSEHVKHAASPSAAVFARGYRGRIGTFVERLPPDAVRVRRYATDGLADGDVVADFWATADLDPLRRPSEPLRLHATPAGAATRLIHHLDLVQPPTVRPFSRDRVRARVLAELATIFAGDGPIPADALAPHLSADDATWVAERFGFDDFVDPCLGTGDPDALARWLAEVPEADVARVLDRIADLGGEHEGAPEPGPVVATLARRLAETETDSR